MQTIRRIVPRALFTAFVVLTLAATAGASHTFPPGACQSDIDGANDEPGQKDVTQWCVQPGDSVPYELYVATGWDETTLSGNNTADVCSLFDTGSDGYADLAVCATLHSSGTLNGNLAVLKSVQLYTCGNTRTDRCTSHTHVNTCTGGASCLSNADCPAGQTCSGQFLTSCEASQEDTDPFSPAAVNGPGDEFPMDTEINCSLDLEDFGPAIGSALLIDTCSYPSTIPNSAPSDCIRQAECTTNADCDDGSECTIGECLAGACTYRPDTGAPCSDGLYCNGDEVCNELGVCAPSTPRDCDDGVSCTLDSCDELTDSCINDPRSSLCDNGQYCDGAEVCDPLLDCQPGTAPNCDDSVSCTVDTCNEATDACDHSPIDAACSDGLYCNGAETCDPLDGCQAGTGPDCDDGIACTMDSCDESADDCAHTPTDAVCSDGDYCNGIETCDALNGCEAGTPPTCDDGIGCTVDACDEVIDACTHLPDNGSCGDGAFCTGIEICDPDAGCLPGTAPCPGIYCDEAQDRCVNCVTDANCSNGVYCDGVETCNTMTGTCMVGTPPSCDDGVACTTDVCDEIADACISTPYDAACDDGLYCNGAETCDPVAGCQNGSPPSCGDGVDCTVDTCNESFDACVHTESDFACDDGAYCNGVETCDAALDCLPGIPVECGDSVVCSLDSCNEAGDACEHDFSACICGDGEVTGSEQCDPPETAGTFEDCNNLVDDDGDGKKDCRDTDCAPGAREPVCDEGCTLDAVCAKFIKDPGVIKYSWDAKPDYLSLHGRFPLDTIPDPVADGLVFELSNEYGAVYRVYLEPGDLQGNPAATRFRYIDKSARLLGAESVRNGLYRVSLIRQTYDGVPYMSFKVRAYGDFDAATRLTMSTQLSIGTATGSLTTDWVPKRRAWKLPLKNF